VGRPGGELFVPDRRLTLSFALRMLFACESTWRRFASVVVRGRRGALSAAGFFEPTRRNLGGFLFWIELIPNGRRNIHEPERAGQHDY
jgi:hypothetical protein